MNTAKVLLLALCCTMLAACARPRHPFPKPYVAVKGQPYYWEIDGDKVFNCFIISSSVGMVTKPATTPAVSATTATLTQPI